MVTSANRMQSTANHATTHQETRRKSANETERMSYKKSRRASEHAETQGVCRRERPDVARRRAQWHRRQGRVDPARLVFSDGQPTKEVDGTKTNMAPPCGCAPGGQRLLAYAPHGHWNTMTFIAALRHNRIEAPWLLDGPVNANCSRTYVEQVLVPKLRPGDLVLMDNFSSHKGPAIRRAIRCAGAKLILLPEYSPDLNPIEQVFAKLKHLLRKACARTKDAVCAAIKDLLETYTPDECANYLKNSGYDRT